MKKYISISFILFLCIGIQLANCQTYTIPDINLRNILIKDYPTLMTPDGELIIAAAKATSQDLNLDNANISNADGIQFFEKTGILRLRNNNLTSIHQLSFMRNVRRVYISNNHLTSFPDISALYQIIDIYLVNNNLTDLPTIAGKTTLQFLTCTGNQINSLPSLSALINLKSLIISHNPISVLPDLSANISLKVLDIKNTNIHTIPSLNVLVNLEILNCENNAFTSLSDLSSNTKLKVLTAQNNILIDLPDFSNKPSLTSINISNNNLTFEDIQPLSLLTLFSVFVYAPQNELSIPLYVNEREPNNYTYQASIDPSITNNQFTWYKGNTPLITNTTGNLVFTQLFMSDSGSYSVRVNNPDVPLLELKSNVSKLIVKSCIEIDNVNAKILSSDCRIGSTIDFSQTIVNGSIAPINFTLTNSATSNEVLGINATQFNNVIQGLYILKATDARNCIASQKYVLDKGDDCQNVLSPNGDGIMDTYFISDSGTAQIYNTSKKIVKTLNLPAEWDGTTNNGSLADAGYYVIIINGSTVTGISLMR